MHNLADFVYICMDFSYYIAHTDASYNVRQMPTDRITEHVIKQNL